MIGGTLVRGSFVGSSSCISISGRLLQFQKNVVALSLSACIAPQLINPVVTSCCPTSQARISLVVSPPLPHQQSSVPAHSRAFPSVSSSASVPRSQSFDAHSLPFPLSSVSLMSSRFAISSSFCGTRLEGLLTTGVRRRYAHNLRGPGYVKASADLRPISQVSNWCWMEGRGVGTMSEGKESKGRTIECYGTSQAGGGDQPTSSSVLPPLGPVSKAKGLAISFCPRCGGATEEKIPVGEHEMRFVCTACGAVHYQNPKMVVGCLVEHEEKVLLCRRNIEPSYGLWTLPAGYMEIGESAAEGAARETLEEACADVQVLGLFAHLDIPFIGQSYIIFRARLKDLHFGPGPESLDCALFKLNEIPFESLAFSSIHVALKMYVEDMKAGKLKVHHGVIDKRPGASPSDLKGFVVRDVLSC